MRLCYQVVAPDVAIVDSVITYQGSLEKSFGDLGRLGRDGAELVILNPEELDWNGVKKTAGENGLFAVLVRTGEIFGQLGLGYIDSREEIRREVIHRNRKIIDFVGFLEVNINIGHVRSQYCSEPSREEAENLTVEAFRELANYGTPKGVKIALGVMTIIQTNFISTLAEGVAMVNRVDHPNFRLMMDTFHLSLEEKDIYGVIRRYSPYSIHVHLVDNNRRCPGHCGLDFEKILTTFKEYGHDDSFCTEIFQIPSMGETAAGTIRHLKPITDRVYGWKVWRGKHWKNTHRRTREGAVKSITLIHTVKSVATSFDNSLKNYLGYEVKIYNSWSDFLANNPNEAEEFTIQNRNRLLYDMKAQELTGANITVTTCFALTPAVELIRPFIRVPVIAVDDATARESVLCGKHIMAMTTAENAVGPTVLKIKIKADKVGRGADISTCAYMDALHVMKAMGIEKYGMTLREKAGELKGYDCIVLTQAFMARLEDETTSIADCPVLTSPRLCMEEIKNKLEEIQR